MAMSASGFERAVVRGSDGARITISLADGTLTLEYELTGIHAPNNGIYAALRTDTADGSFVLPFGAGFEGSTVFLPFPANYLAMVKTSVAGDERHLRVWNATQWSERYEAVREFSEEIAQDRCTITIPLAELGNPRKITLAIWARDLRQNDGWGKFFGCNDPAVLAGTGNRYITTALEIDPAGAGGVAVKRRSQGGSRARIYQLFVRLFGNTNESREVNGTLKQNGVGKFSDINDAALRSLGEMGFTHLWLTGVLQQATSTDYTAAGQPADDPDLLKGLAGSPYAIRDYYDVCPDYAEKPASRLDEFKALIARIHERKLKALIDFVPNHVARSYHSDVTPDEDFGTRGRGGRGDDRAKFFDPHNNFFYLTGPGSLQLPTCKDGQPVSPTCKVLEGKCDGLFEGEKDFGRVTGNNVASWTPSLTDWYETAKLNYGFDFTNPSVREYPHGSEKGKLVPDTWRKMDRVLAYWQSLGVDGFRCDMAHMQPPEFWRWAISRARSRNPDVLFVGEAYENDPARVPGGDPLLQTLNDGKGSAMLDLLNAGFDAVYDDPSYKALKSIYDGPGWANDVDRAMSEAFIFNNSLRYAENHDEVRLAGTNEWGRIGKEVGRPVSAILFGIGRGPVMIYNGQEVGEPANGEEGFGGDDARTTVFDYWSMPELVKWVNGGRFDGGKLRPDQRQLRAFYSRLLHLVDQPAFRDGECFGLNSANQNQAQFGNIEGDSASGHWMYGFLRFDVRTGQRFLVVVNLHPAAAFENVHVRIPPEALEFLRAENSKAEWTWKEQLSTQGSLSIKAPPASFAIPRIPPLTPYYFEINSSGS
jgi:glycosidase